MKRKFPFHWKNTSDDEMRKEKPGKKWFAFIVIENIRCAFIPKMFIVHICISKHFGIHTITWLCSQHSYLCSSTLSAMRIMPEPDTHTNANHIEKIMASQRVRWNLFSFICHICNQMDFHYGCIPCISTRTLALSQCMALIFIARCMWIVNGMYTLTRTYIVCGARPETYRQMRVRMIGCIFILILSFFLIWTVGQFKNKYFQECFIKKFRRDARCHKNIEQFHSFKNLWIFSV